MVLGESNHFLMIAGYFDAAETPNSVYEDSSIRWIVLADHWPGDLLDRLPHGLRGQARKTFRFLADHGLDLGLCLVNTPIRCKRWRDMREDMIERGHRILVFAR
jgi:hypothetical protein